MYVLFLILACWYASATEEALFYSLDNAAQYFEEYIYEYEKSYANIEEKEARFKIFKENLNNINSLNADRSSDVFGPNAIYGITQFSDITLEEFQNMYTGFDQNATLDNSQCQVLTDKDIAAFNAPESLDWRQSNAVTKVKNQGNCESCYAFSTTGHLEGQYAIKHNQLVELSEQQIVDCDKKSRGCKRGFMSYALMSIMQLGGIMKGTEYPYQARDGRCQFNRNKAVVKVTRCFTYKLRSQEKLKQLLAKTGPISVAVKADNLKGYRKGVIADAKCQRGQINHAVLLVGYGTDPQEGPYWLVKNSYAAKFGEQGYFRMQRGEGAHSCGMMNDFITTATIQ